jgi:hypothetical protein
MYVRASPNYLRANHVKQKYQPEQESFVTAQNHLLRKWSCTYILLMKRVLSLSIGVDGFLPLELYGLGEQQYLIVSGGHFI